MKQKPADDLACFHSRTGGSRAYPSNLALCMSLLEGRENFNPHLFNGVLLERESCETSVSNGLEMHYYML
jgi:hypothetical protein